MRFLAALALLSWAVPAQAQTSCARELRQAGLAVTPIPAREAPGVPEPLALPDVVGGVAFVPLSRREQPRLVADCLLAKALLRAAPILRRFGIVEAHWSRSYTPLAKLSNRRSAHQWARAIDVHEFVRADRTVLRVLGTYPIGDRTCPDAGASPQAPPGPFLRALACALFEGAFDMVLTPNYNAEHHDHFHCEVRTDSYRSLD